MRAMRQCAQWLVLRQQAPCGGQRTRHVLSQTNDEVSLHQVQGDNLLHLLVTQSDGGRQSAVYVDVKLAPTAEEVGHFTVPADVAYCKHAQEVCINGAERTLRTCTYANFAHYEQPITSEKQQIVKFVYR